jgi:hypothetical protein
MFVVKRIRSLKVVCPHCKVPMQEQSDEGAVIQFSPGGECRARFRQRLADPS